MNRSQDLHEVAKKYGLKIKTIQRWQKSGLERKKRKLLFPINIKANDSSLFFLIMSNYFIVGYYIIIRWQMLKIIISFLL